GSAFAWVYTQAGRLQSQSDPFTGKTITPDNYYTIGNSTARQPYYPSSLKYVPETYSFDSYGRTTGVTLPAGVFSQSTIGFDLEDGVTGTSGKSVQAPNSVVTVACATSNVRNEKLPMANGGCGGFLYNGAQFASQASVLPNNQSFYAPWTLDARAGMLMSWQGATQPSGNASSGRFAYDASGRMVSDVEQLDRPWRASDGTMAGNEVFSTGTRTKSYDAENRLRSQQTSPATGATYPLWGEYNPGGYWDDVGQGAAYDLQAVDYNANSHPMRFSATQNPEFIGPQPPVTFDWLWDGNDVLAECGYTNTSSQCSAYGFMLEGLGAYFPSNGYLSIYDRSLTGQVVASHDAIGFSGMKLVGRNSRNYFFGGVNASGAPGSVSPDDGSGPTGNAMITGNKMALDGWTFANNTWQGVRTYDASVGQWNTPDAYAGEVHDPMSQKPFMWNRNNPYAYSDPTGYCVGPFVIVCYEILVAGSALVAEAAAPGLGGLGGPATAAGKMLVIGKTAELETLGAGERSLLPQLQPKLSTPKLNWSRNAGALRDAMRKGDPIGDKHVNADGSLITDTYNSFLNAERALLRERGWTYDQGTRTWRPPPPTAQPGPPPKPR
ncbi:MAG: hypothetical protein M3N13_10795, partial [Candidatus Eremiobacteraeota bacterium]|nr:hypothetical protein [Candidatus Eremiobacteraeota bacterium]